MTEARLDRATAPRGARIIGLDLARSALLVAMAVFHTAKDLEMFGLIPPGTTFSGGWPIFAKTVAAGFLFLVGVGLQLGHGAGIRWTPFWRRLAKIVAGAGLVTLATRIALPQGFVFFGILHSIAVASVLGLAFLRLPALLTLAVAGVVFVAPQVYHSAAFDPVWLQWIGFADRLPRTIDFEPVFPWFAPCLLGIAAAKIARSLTPRRVTAPRSEPSALLRRLAWPGRHALAVYLIHQPVLLAILWLGIKLFR